MKSPGRKEGEGLLGDGPLWRLVLSLQLCAQSASYIQHKKQWLHNKVIYKLSVRKGLKCMNVIISHRSSGPLLHSGAPQDKRTEVGVSE